MAVEGLLFDFDGLLVDTEVPSRTAWEELYREHGHDLPHDRWLTLVGTVRTPDTFDPMLHLEQLVGTPLEWEALTARRRSRQAFLAGLEVLRPGVAEYLAEARRLGLRTAIVSSGERSGIDRHLERLECAEGWGCIVAADGDARRAKPSPALYVEALAALGLEPAQAIAFEDSLNGVRAAKAAGLSCVAVPNPITASLALDEADLVLGSLEELPLVDLIKRVSG